MKENQILWCACLFLLASPVMMSCLNCSPFCDNYCYCNNDGYECTSNCCYNYECRDMDICSGALAGWAIALIVIGVLFCIFIFIMCLACCCGICSCILCCCRQNVEERRRAHHYKHTTQVVYTQQQSPPPQSYQPAYPAQPNQQFVQYQQPGYYQNQPYIPTTTSSPPPPPPAAVYQQAPHPPNQPGYPQQYGQYQPPPAR